jgi:hypothetical protein
MGQAGDVRRTGLWKAAALIQISGIVLVKKTNFDHKETKKFPGDYRFSRGPYEQNSYGKPYI